MKKLWNKFWYWYWDKKSFHYFIKTLMSRTAEDRTKNRTDRYLCDIRKSKFK